MTPLLFVALFAAVSGQSPAGKLVNVQVFHRHGGKTPDNADPNNAQFWENIHHNALPGDLTDQGVVEMEVLGKFLAAEYVGEDKLLPPEPRRELQRFRASSGGTNYRVLTSAEAVAANLYPQNPGGGSNVYNPIETINPFEEDTLMLSTINCPSYVAEYERIEQRLTQEFDNQYGDLIDVLRNVTGFLGAGYEYNAYGYIHEVSDNILCESSAGFPNHPALAEYRQLIYNLNEYLHYEEYKFTDDRRFPISGEGARAILENLENFDTVDTRLFVYSMHYETLQALWIQLNLGPHLFYFGEAFILELIETPTGQLLVQAKLARLNLETMVYSTSPAPLACPSPSLSCPISDFVIFLSSYNPSPPLGPEGTEGCCFVGDGFYDHRCDDFLNPATVDEPVCNLYRTFCPQSSCNRSTGQRQVVDSVSLMCVQVI